MRLAVLTDKNGDKIAYPPGCLVIRKDIAVDLASVGFVGDKSQRMEIQESFEEALAEVNSALNYCEGGAYPNPGGTGWPPQGEPIWEGKDGE